MRWLVFDYGEVISRRPAALPDLARLLGAPLEPFETAYWASRDAYDRGLTDHAYWAGIGKAVGAVVDEELSATLTQTDITGWLGTDPATLKLIDELSEAGIALALLSNAPASSGRVYEQQPWARHFRHLIFSGDLPSAKPDPAIWQLLVQRLNAAPTECLFLDDRQVNIDGARAAGLNAEVWTTAASARTHLVDLGVLGP